MITGFGSGPESELSFEVLCLGTKRKAEIKERRIFLGIGVDLTSPDSIHHAIPRDGCNATCFIRVQLGDVGAYEKLIDRRETSLLLLHCYLLFDTVSSDPWTSERFDFPYLRIPSHRQPDEEAYCVPYALWMVISYVANEYDDPTIR